MKTKEQIKQVLEKWKFPMLQEKENSVVFRYQMNYVQANITSDDDPRAITLTLCGIFNADDHEKMFNGMRTCNELNCNLFQVKLYIDPDGDLIIANEFTYITADDLEDLFSLALKSVVLAKKRFLQRYGELEEEAKLLSELEEE